MDRRRDERRRHAVEERRRGADGDQRVHVARALLERAPGTLVEAGARDELHRRGQQEHQVLADHHRVPRAAHGVGEPLGDTQRNEFHERRDHRDDEQRDREREREDEHALLVAVRLLPRLALHVDAGLGTRERVDLHDRVVAGVAHGGDELVDADDLRVELDGAGLAGQVHGRGLHAGHLGKRLLDERRARGAGHAHEAEGHATGRARGSGLGEQGGLVAELAHDLRDPGGVDHRRVERGDELLGGEVDRRRRDAGRLGERLLDDRRARRAGHAADREGRLGVGDGRAVRAERLRRSVTRRRPTSPGPRLRHGRLDGVGHDRARAGGAGLGSRQLGCVRRLQEQRLAGLETGGLDRRDEVVGRVLALEVDGQYSGVRIGHSRAHALYLLGLAGDELLAGAAVHADDGELHHAIGGISRHSCLPW